MDAKDASAARSKAARIADKTARKKARRAARAAAAAAASSGAAGEAGAVPAAAEGKVEALRAAAAAAARRAEELWEHVPQRFSCMTKGSTAGAHRNKNGKRGNKGNGPLDLAEGLVLHRNAVSEEFEQELIEWVLRECERGRRGLVRKPTYLRASGARSQGNAREALMYGGFFDFNRARPGKRGLVPPFPPILNRLVAMLVDEKGLLPVGVRPDSVIINSYSAGDCIPPHVDHPSYYRPISTLSLLGEEPMLIGSKFRTVKACTWEPVVGLAVPCPRRSLLVLGGNSGNIAKHCISSCSGPRISITLRKQPPPDWRPDTSELKRGKKNGRGISTSGDTGGGGDGGNSSSGEGGIVRGRGSRGTNNETDRQAKRRKKNRGKKVRTTGGMFGV